MLGNEISTKVEGKKESKEYQQFVSPLSYLVQKALIDFHFNCRFLSKRYKKERDRDWYTYEMHLSSIYVITLLIETASELDILIYEGRHFLRYNVSVYKKNNIRMAM